MFTSIGFIQEHQFLNHYLLKTDGYYFKYGIKQENYSFMNTLESVLNTPIEEIKNIIDKFEIDPYIAREIATPSPKSRIEFDDDSIYLIIHFPANKHTHTNQKQEIDFVIKKDYSIILYILLLMNVNHIITHLN